MMEAARFFAVAVGGLVLDLAIAWSAAHIFGLPLWLAAAVGFILAAGANYIMHELWTFREGARQVSSIRAFRYGLALALTLMTRVLVVAVLTAILGDRQALAILLAAALVSFCVTFAISKKFVFRSGPGADFPK